MQPGSSPEDLRHWDVICMTAVTIAPLPWQLCSSLRELAVRTTRRRDGGKSSARSPWVQPRRPTCWQSCEQSGRSSPRTNWGLQTGQHGRGEWPRAPSHGSGRRCSS